MKLISNPSLDLVIAEQNSALLREGAVQAVIEDEGFDHAASAVILGEITDIDSSIFKFSALSATSQLDLDNPHYNQAINGPYSESWLAAIKEEVDSLVEEGTGILVPPSKDQKSIGCRFVLTTKRDENGLFVKRKARYVAKGYLQEFGVNYTETFASVSRSDSIRTIIAKAAQFGFILKTFDIKRAFLAADIDMEGIIVDPPPSLTVGAYSGFKWLLKKSLYGLKQAPRCWWEKLNKTLLDFGFVVSEGDECLYVFHSKDGSIFLSIHVDDGLLAGSTETLLQSFKTYILNVFEGTWVDNPKTYLGFNIIVDSLKGTVQIGHHTYILALVERFGLSSTATKSTPFPSFFELHLPTATEINAGRDLEYRGLVGGLMWVALGTRPDIMQAVSVLAQHYSHPSPRLYKLAQHVLLYLSGTLDYFITYSSTTPLTTPSPHVFSDSDYAADISVRSRTAYVVMIAGGAVSWHSKLQSTITQSTCEAEYVALNETTKQCVWMEKILSTMDFPSTSTFSRYNLTLPFVIHGDNEGSEALSKNSSHHQRTKHIKVKFHYIREVVADKVVRIQHVKSKENVADILTKRLPETEFAGLRLLMGIQKAVWEY